MTIFKIYILYFFTHYKHPPHETGGHPQFHGFKGCMRGLYVAQRIIDIGNLLVDKSAEIVDAQIGSCAIRDR